MGGNSQKRQAALSWMFIGVLFVLCGLLGVLQYRWIGEVSLAARERMHASLQASLDRVSRDFQTELFSACRTIAPDELDPDAASLAADVAEHYQAWKNTSNQARLFRSVALVTRDGDNLILRIANAEGRFEPASWPAEWSELQTFLQSMAGREGRGFRGGMGGPAVAGTAFEIPIFSMQPPPFNDRAPNERGPQIRRNAAWMIYDLDARYVGETLLPDLLQRHLGTAGALEYRFELSPRGNREAPIYTSDQGVRIANPDATALLFDVPPDFFRRGRGGRPFDPGRAMGAPASGRWELAVRHRSGSLEAVVARARQRNLAVTGGVLLLIIASAFALMRFTRRSQRLAELQMNFVAGVSHELRTPLTVINTAAYNLQSKVSRNPEQVAKYGALIRQESGRLKELVEQVLSFAGSQAGSIIQETQPLAVENIVDASLEASKAVVEGAHFTVERKVAADLPLVAGDARALQHAVQNLITNSVKYGGGDENWIGISADTAGDGYIEIRVADRGQGIPSDEQRYLFDPFFRGKRAVQDQIHGTGLGLTLVKEIVDAHHGTIAVRSHAGKGTEFVIRIPVAPKEYQDEFANSVSRG